MIKPSLLAFIISIPYSLSLRLVNPGDAEIKKVNIRTAVDKDAQSQFAVNTLDFEYAMTREEQAAAKKAAKANLPQSEENSSDSGSNQGSGGSDDDTGLTE